MEAATTYMLENPFYYPGMTPEEYEQVIGALAFRDDDILNDVLYGKIILKPRSERNREYIFGVLEIK